MPTQTIPNLDNLLHVLNAATDKNNLHWKTTADDDTFRTDIGLGMVQISQGPDGGSFVLSLIDEDGKMLERFQPQEAGGQLAIEALFKKARRQALNLDWKLQSVYDQLKNLAGES